jgi:hypothetical protein
VSTTDQRRPPRNAPTRANGHDTPTPRTHEPIHDINAEKAVLGAMMLHSDAIRDARECLGDGREFYLPHHATIYQAITELHDGSNPVDAVTLAHHLAKLGEINRVGGLAYLHTLMDSVPNSASAGYYAEILAETYRLRVIAEIGTRFSQMARATHIDDIDLILDQARAELEAAPRSRSQAPQGPVNWQELWATPDKPVDLMAGGLLAAGKITLLFSPGKVGKSLLAQDIAVSLALGLPALGDSAREKVTVLYIDQEMTPDDWRDRLTAMRILPDDDLSHLVLYQLHPWPPFDSPEGGNALAKVAETHNAQLVVIDTLSKTLAGPENDNDTHQSFYRNTLVPLKRDGRAVLILDHTGKDIAKGARGGSAKTDNIDLAFELSLRGRDLLTARRTHSRFRHPSEYLFLKRNPEPLTHERESVDETLEHTIAACIRHIEQVAPAPEDSARDVLARVKDECKAGYRTATFNAAFARYRGSKGWDR